MRVHLGIGSNPEFCNLAKESCYIGSNIHQVGQEEIEEVYRGCSFVHPDPDQRCYETEMPSIGEDAFGYGICKESCITNNCNDYEHTKPNNPIEGNWPKCQVCSVTMDEANNTVGAGQEDCWEGDDRFNQYCPNEDDVCETEFLVDWFPRGIFNF